MKVLWLIPARSGSKSIENKNVKHLAGIPLLAHRILTLKEIQTEEDEIWLSTDSLEYAEIGRQYGASIPFMRPAHLATDIARSEDVVEHAMRFAEENGRRFDAIGLIEPTSPFVKSKDIEDGLAKLFENEEADAIVAVKESRPNSFFIQEDAEFLTVLSQRLKSQKILGRQNYRKEITPSGGFYIAKWSNYKIEKTFYTPKTLSFEVDEISSLEIDEPFDWLFAEFILNLKNSK